MLAADFPDRPETPILKLKWESGSFGNSTRLGRLIDFHVCPSGLRVKPVLPPGRTFFVPWQHLRLERLHRTYGDVAALRFGDPEVGRLNVMGHVANRMARAVPARWPETAPLQDETRAHALFVIARAWVLFSVLWLAMAGFVLWSSSSKGGSPPPLAIVLVPLGISAAVSILAYYRRVKR